MIDYTSVHPPKKRIKRQKWTDAEIAQLLKLVDGFKARGLRPRWREIAAATGHHDNSCVVKYHSIRSREADLAARKEIDQKIAAAEARPLFKTPVPHDVPMKPRVQNPEFGRGTSTWRLQIDAEMRSRIAVRGVTGGLLGDPMPGRSALDRRRAGIVDPPPPIDHRTAKLPPKVTLATDPMQ